MHFKLLIAFVDDDRADAVLTAARPPSRAAMRSSNMAQVGLVRRL